MNNSFIGIGAVLVHTDDVSLPVNSQAINNAGTPDDRTACGLIGLISYNAFDAGLYTDFICLDYDGFIGECNVYPNPALKDVY